MLDFIKRNFLSYLIILIISFLFTKDLFFHKGIPVTFDGPTHISNMAQISNGLRDGDFPVRWGEGWARYGWPAPIFAQQVTSYLGGLLDIIFRDIILSYNLVVFLGVFLTTLVMCIFLRFYVGKYSAIAGALIFAFAPYRIMNVYIRGAIPEFWASAFIILILIALYIIFIKNNLNGYFLLSFSIGLLLLTHPFMLIVGSIIIIPYSVFVMYKAKSFNLLSILLLALSGLLGFGLASYYLIPLFLESKYLYYGGLGSHFASGHFLSLDRYLFEYWPYFTKNDIGPRGHYHIGGILEGIILLSAIFFIVFNSLKKKFKEGLFLLFLLISFVYIFFTLEISELFYKNFAILGNIQHPWRMLTGFILIPPILAALIIDKSRYKKGLLLIMVLLISFLRFPQLYGKNYTIFPQQIFYITDDNMHGTIMNTVWMGEVRDYPYVENKIDVISGEVLIRDLETQNSYKSFRSISNNDARIVDYTFYFPGWKVFINGIEQAVEFQDPNYRGLITFNIPKGDNLVGIKFVNTKPRFLGNLFSILSLTILGAGYFKRKYIFKLQKLKIHD